MYNYQVIDIINDVKVAIDQNKSSAPLAALGDIDTLTLDDIIKSKIVDASRLVELGAAHWLLGEGEPFGDSIDWESQPGYGAGRILLPDDFVRLVTFKMSDWSRAVTVAISEDHPLYAQQSSRFGGVRGNPEKPVVAIVNDPVGLVLEFYSCAAGSGVRIHRAQYIPMRVIGDDRKIRLNEKLYRAIVYRCASLTAISVGESELGAVLERYSNQLAEIEQQ